MRWTREQIGLIAENFERGDLKALAEQIGCTETQLRSKASNIGIGRDPDIKRETRRKQLAKARKSRYA